jgi:hypothetical protein
MEFVTHLDHLRGVPGSISTCRSSILTEFLFVSLNTGIVVYNKPCSFPITFLKTGISPLEITAPQDSVALHCTSAISYMSPTCAELTDFSCEM